VDYEITTYPIKVVEDRLVFFTSGLDDIAFDVLNQIGTVIDGDPALENYKKKIAEDKGASLSLINLEEIGEDIVKRTAAKHRAEVGLPLQSAAIENGKVTILKEPFVDSTQYQLPSRVSNIVFVNEFGGGALGGKGFFMFRSGIQGGAKKSVQHLDGIYFYESHFDKCKLMFDGDPESIFDSSNTVTDSELIVRSIDQLTTPFVLRFKRNFPSIQVRVDPTVF